MNNVKAMESVTALSERVVQRLCKSSVKIIFNIGKSVNTKIRDAIDNAIANNGFTETLFVIFISGIFEIMYAINTSDNKIIRITENNGNPMSCNVSIEKNVIGSMAYIIK